MYGVIVVPTTATISSRMAGDRSSDGVTSARPTCAPVGIRQQRGRDVREEHDDDGQEDALDRPVAGLEDKGPDGDAHDRDHEIAARSRRSPARPPRRRTRPRCWRRWPPAGRSSRTRSGATPNRSRIRSDRPCPVTTPSRAAISWTMARMTIVIGNSHSSDRPVVAPMTLYVVIPPASLPAIPAMSPGPMTARKARMPAPAAEPAAQADQRRARRSARGCARTRAARSLAPRSGARHAPPPAGRQDGVDRVVDGHDPGQPPLGVDDRDGEQVVARDDARHVVAVGRHAGPRPARAIMTSPIGASGRATMRSRSDRTPTRRRVVVDDVHVVDRLGVGLELAQPVDRLGSPSGARPGRRRTRSSSSRRRCPPGSASSSPHLLRLVALHAGRGSRRGVVRSGRRRDPRRRPGDISSRMSAARSGASSSRTSTCVSGSISSMASATASSSSAARTPARSRGAQLVDDRGEVSGVELGQARRAGCAA